MNSEHDGEFSIPTDLLDELALTTTEYEQIVRRLCRQPNTLELGIFGSMWSEHCGYKHSRPLLGLFSQDSERVLVPAGTENAGVVDIGDGLAAAFKIESHNHPSAIEPFQGAATGVGGIVRDILAMGARPIALLNSLRFGPLEEPRQRHLFQGVVSGISWYGNCIGIPDVGGEIGFAPAYSGNPLVNAMCVGILPKDGLIRAQAKGNGNLLILVGAETGRDGIHGASGLASRTFQEQAGLRSAVQVANPFLEKVLIEACLAALKYYPDSIIGMQDLGAAGLTSSLVECAGRGGAGVEIDISLVPRREKEMTPYEVMLSESQERMLLIIKATALEEIKAFFSTWDLSPAVIGRVTDDAHIVISENDSRVADLPIDVLLDPPTYQIPGVKPDGLTALQEADLHALNLEPLDPEEVLLELLGSANICSRSPVSRQYDQHVGNNTVISSGLADAAVLRIPQGLKGLALTIDGNSRLCHLDPYIGGAIAVAEACRNLSCVGAEPIALTDCLNFGNPERPDIYYQLEQCIKGMAQACSTLGVPIVSGNVSLYNETQGQSIHPTPIVGGLGLLADVANHCTASFKHSGDLVFLLGKPSLSCDISSLGGSEFLQVIHNTVVGQPVLDLDLEVKLQRLCRRAILEGLLNSAHDCAEGGLAVTLAESCILGNIGVSLNPSIVDELAPSQRTAALFGEEQSRIIVSLPRDKLQRLEELSRNEAVECVYLGEVGGERLHVPDLVDLSIEELNVVWDSGFEKISQGDASVPR
jgi:phosphoribosylformylglycinamidine synthase II